MVDRTSTPPAHPLEQYIPPPWARKLSLVPHQRYRLGMLTTPVQPWRVPGVPAGCQLYIKRDDLTGMQLSGNKVRKLEFILAEAVAAGHDSVITVGGIQSNHARATAVAARYLGLDCHLILRNSRQLADDDPGHLGVEERFSYCQRCFQPEAPPPAADPGLVGNLLVERLTGAHIWQVTKEEYARYGAPALGATLVEQLRTEHGINPYFIPVGGSSPLGCWGYLEAARELEPHLHELGITDVAMACGSGGTTAGLALGLHLSGAGVRVHAYGVCDDPAYFYSYCDSLLAGMGATPEAVGADAAGMFRAVQAKGEGYALSTEAELGLIADVALATGVILDPVYTGKALHALLTEMQARPADWAGRNVIFIHTGGLMGMYDKLAQLQPIVASQGRAHRLQVSA